MNPRGKRRYIGLAEEAQRAVVDPASPAAAGKGGGFVTDLSELVAEFRSVLARIEIFLGKWTAWISRSTGTSPCASLTSSWTPTLARPRCSPGTIGS